MTDPTLPIDPAPVSVQNQDPIPVEVQNDEPLRVRTEQDKVAATRVSSTEKALAEAKVGADATRATARVDADILMTEGQRAINRLWERTQAIIAISIVFVTLGVVTIVVVSPLFRDNPDQVMLTASAAGLVLLSNLVGNVTGSYFTRTNHVKIGGVGGNDPRRGE